MTKRRPTGSLRMTLRDHPTRCYACGQVMPPGEPIVAVFGEHTMFVYDGQCP